MAKKSRIRPPQPTPATSPLKEVQPQPAGLQYLAAQWWMQLLVLAVLVGITYGHTLNVPFYMDDFITIRDNPAILDPGDLHSLWHYAPLRVVGYFTFALNYHFHQFQVAGYHLLNILIHFLAGCAVFGLVKGLNRTPGAGRSEIWLPFLAALIFVLHPLQTQAVTYIVQRLASLTGLFYITSLACYVQARLHKDTAAKWLWAAATLLAAGLAFFTKQNAVTLPLAILLTEIIFFPGNTKRLALTTLLTIAGLGAAYILLALLLGSNPFSLAAMQSLTQETTILSRGVYLANQTMVLWTYIRLFFWPAGQHLDYNYLLAPSFADWRVMAALAGHFALIGLAVYHIRRYRFISYGILFFYIAHLVESSVIPIKDVIFEHRTYLPNLGLSLGTAWFVTFVGYRGAPVRRAFAVTGAAALIVALLGMLTYARNTVWQNPVTLWADSVSKSPGEPRSLCNLGLALYEEGKIDQAIDYYQAALRIMPELPEARLNLGLALQQQGKPAEAVAQFEAILRADPAYAKAHSSLHNNLGSLYYDQGRIEEAVAQYQEALRIDPNLAETKYNLAAAFNKGGLLLGKQGEIDKAIEQFLKALQIRPDYAEAHNNLGVAFHRQGKIAEAASQFEEALRLDPDHARARHNLEALRGK